MYKSAEAQLLTNLKPHQQRVLDKAKLHNLLIAHGTGSGKTLSSIAAAMSINKPVEVVTPASLVDNYKKEIAKHTSNTGRMFNVESIGKRISRGMDIRPGNTVVLDESHNVRNTDTERYKYVEDELPDAGRIIALTATPAYNSARDIAPLINLVRQKQVLPTGSDFDKQYVAEHKTYPGVIDRFIYGIKPGVDYRLKNKDKLLKILSGYVDVYENKQGFPESTTEDIRVTMTPEQQEYYETLGNKAPFWLRYKIEKNMPPSKTESKSLNAFMTGLRQSSMSSAPYNKNITPLEAARQSSKLMRAAKETEKSLKQGRNKIFAYTNWLEAGAIPYQHLLESQGIKSAVFHGGLSPREKQQLVNEYNNGDLQVLIGTSSAGEGLDLKNTRLIQVLDPHFNESRIKQAIGRGIRLGSHNTLPEDQRNVKVQRYYSQPIKKPGIFARLLLQARDTSGKGADEWLHDRAVEKQRLIDSLVQIMGEATNRPVAG